MKGVRPKAAGIITHGPCICVAEVSPSEVDAGGELTVTARVSCPHGCDLTGLGVSIRNQHDTELARAELSMPDGEGYLTKAFAARAPLETGAHIYRMVVAPYKKDGVLHEGTSTEFSFRAMAHAASVNVWGWPSAIAAGERFKFKVGVKCSAGCKLAGRPFRICDHEGAQIGAASLTDDIWPGTSALYFAEVEAEAPPAAGDYTWRLEVPASNLNLPHAASSCVFAVKAVSAPDSEVTVEARHRETQTPIVGAQVLLHPYRAVTDERGIAKVKVRNGRYKLFVSGFRFIAYQAVIDVAGDVTAKAELTPEPEGQEDYR